MGQLLLHCLKILGRKLKRKIANSVESSNTRICDRDSDPRSRDYKLTVLLIFVSYCSLFRYRILNPRLKVASPVLRTYYRDHLLLGAPAWICSDRKSNPL
jgi:hypothetical protein